MIKNTIFVPSLSYRVELTVEELILTGGIHIEKKYST